MNFSQDWDQRYRANTHLSIWPWSDLVSYVMRYARPQSSDFRVLELGCGAGANIPFFNKLGVQYYAIEGSPHIVEQLQTTYPDLHSRIVAGDFTLDLPFDGTFDLVVDRSALTFNTTTAIQQSLGQVYAKLKPGGAFIGIDWYSTQAAEYQRGEPTEDPYTRTHYTEGPFAHTGRVHFSDKPHLLNLFHQFEITILEHKLLQREIPQDGFSLATWNLVAKKAL
ncbi:hypothetical protein BST81_25180 [Leptolyngbya sp. 'hensonii']|uniref:class I SAM-dependent methyltransferase n=1 Tax=Leptolyngbya sp. 'hensonii' TaxID=1922337 RepID=UPI0009500B2E|nr:class I SAM-dependent methyltransferase [Leptolyngbya sp. 'hensonii']OLP15648.1 hypothetical protein BST81_25180 [Leptolyngbya sp. 'hensonii']